MYNRPAAGCVSVIIGMDFTINRCVQGHHVSKEFWTPEEKSCLVDTRKAIQMACTQPKLANGAVKFSAHSISDFAMNIIMAKTFPNVIISAIHQNIFPPKFPATQYISQLPIIDP